MVPAVATGSNVLDARLADALLSLLAHDLRSPLGPLTLATSLIVDDPALPVDLRDLARVAEAQAGRIGRMIEGVLSAVRGPRAPDMEPADLAAITEEAAALFRSLGGECEVDAEPTPVIVDRALLRGALAGLIEAAAGEGGSARATVAVDGSSAAVHLQATDWAECARALATGAPCDGRSALALGAAAVFRAHSGGVEAAGDQIVAWIPAGGP